VNGPSADIAPFIDADERFVLFASNRTGGAGDFDLYISLRRDGAWQPAVSLGPVVNTAASESNPAVSPDGVRLLFSRGDGNRVVLHEMRFDPRWLDSGR
jgi:Tol biopolymer transport system component